MKKPLRPLDPSDTNLIKSELPIEDITGRILDPQYFPIKGDLILELYIPNFNKIKTTVLTFFKQKMMANSPGMISIRRMLKNKNVSVFIFILTFKDRACDRCVRKLYHPYYRRKKPVTPRPPLLAAAVSQVSITIIKISNIWLSSYLVKLKIKLFPSTINPSAVDEKSDLKIMVTSLLLVIIG
ncbi:hypothetical protein AGLY_007160 [Aphis glycines]|uniref:Uncharacterized protein n=1 Tax=Aphis glycines TaxID=307491 RepID=A0A6G0TPC4_APHGL|nr:hypothetical protein AGLY_007160 [Aphis glycines]